MFNKCKWTLKAQIGLRKCAVSSCPSLSASFPCHENPYFFHISALTENRFSGPGGGDAGTIYRIVAYVWIVLGLAYVALIINYISNVLVRKAEKMERMSKARIEVNIYQFPFFT